MRNNTREYIREVYSYLEISDSERDDISSDIERLRHGVIYDYVTGDRRETKERLDRDRGSIDLRGSAIRSIMGAKHLPILPRPAVHFPTKLRAALKRGPWC